MTALKEADRVYSSRIIKAGALLADARILCREWDERLSDRENLERFVLRNLFGKGSRTRTQEVLEIFRRRYLLADGTGPALRRYVREVRSSSAVDRVLYYHAAKADALLYDFAASFLFGLRSRGQSAVTLTDTIEFLEGILRRRRTTAPWRGETLRRVAHGLLATTRDFGVLAGRVRKSILDPHLPLETFLYVLWRLRSEVSGVALLEHPDWRLFLLRRDEIERSLAEGAQRQLVRYEALGQIVRLDLPFRSLDEVVDAVTR